MQARHGAARNGRNNLSDFFTIARQIQEAHAVGLGIPVARQFSDDDLAASHEAIGDVERGKVFSVTVATAQGVEHINLLAEHSCDAVIKAVEMLFPEFDDAKPAGLSIKVTPVKSGFLRVAA